MKRILAFGFVIIFFVVSEARSELAGLIPSADSSTPVAVSTTPPSVAMTGETISSSAPVAMTDRGGPGAFVTLTRSTQSIRDLPFNTQTVSQDLFKMYDAQNAGDAVSRLTGVSVARQGDLGTARLAGIRGSTPNETLVLIDGRPVGGA